MSSREDLRAGNGTRKTWNVSLTVQLSVGTPKEAAELGIDVLARRLAEGGTVSVVLAPDPGPRQNPNAFQFSFAFGVREATIAETETSCGR